jgi:uncharacterized protein
MNRRAIAAAVALLGLAAKVLLLSLATGTGAQATTLTPYPDPAALEAWRADRVAGLTGEDGWLTPVGLLWLEAGELVYAGEY